MQTQFGDVQIKVSGHVAVVEIQRGPNNYFDYCLIDDLATAYESLDKESEVRAIVLCSQGKNFCAGGDFRNTTRDEVAVINVGDLYTQAVRLFRTNKPVIAAIQGAAVGGGLGLACSADFRFAAPATRFCANFSKLAMHAGFGLSHTLPRLIGNQKSQLMFYTGRRIPGEQAFEWGLADQLCAQDSLRDEAIKFAAEIAAGAPIAIESMRLTARHGLADAVRLATLREQVEQGKHMQTQDHVEGVLSVNERREPVFRRL
jgi:enoyl-CoA hydratase/carnithine racemase